MEECLVLNDRAADSGTELVLAEGRRLLVELVRERVARVQRVVAEELPKRAVELVRARLGDHIDDASEDTSEFRLVVVRLNLELLNRIDNRRNDVHVADVIGVVEPIQEVDVHAVPLTVDGRVRKRRAGHAHICQVIAADSIALRGAHRSRARSQGQQLREVATVEREVLHHLHPDDRAELRGRLLQLLRLGRDLDRFSHLANLQNKVLSDGLVDADIEGRKDGCLESSLLGHQRVVARLNIHEHEKAARVRLARDFDARAHVGERDGGARDHRAGRISDRAVHASQGALGQQGSPAKQAQEHEQRDSCAEI